MSSEERISSLSEPESLPESLPDPMPEKMRRRDILKSLASVPVFGVFFFSLWKKKAADDFRKNEILAELGLDGKAPAILPKSTSRKSGDLIRLGIIGFGGRGEYLARCVGFAHPDWVEEKKTDALKNKLDKEFEHFLNQEDLNVALTAVCDIFDRNADRGLAAARNEVRPRAASTPPGEVKRYRHYQDLLESKDVDAAIIATPDHWHARQAIDAVSAGKHVYLEKCMTRTFEETVELTRAVKKSGRVFQLGHQNRQQESHIKARMLVERKILGNITLVETSTNRNHPVGAWVYEIPEEANPRTIDWEQFQAPSPNKVPFSRERYFRWRCWFDYGTGLSGDLLSHEYDAVNQILEVGIPRFAVASGGIYFYKDGRDVPDVFQAVFEYPERDLTFIYTATLANGRFRPKLFMGHDATMEVGASLTVTADSGSTRYKDKILKEVIDTGLPLFSYRPGAKGIDTVTSATEQYFASRGLMYTYREGRRLDVGFLHVKEWIDCIRNGGIPSCNIDRGFEEAVTCHMATLSYLKGRKVEWDPVNQKIV